MTCTTPSLSIPLGAPAELILWASGVRVWQTFLHGDPLDGGFQRPAAILEAQGNLPLCRSGRRLVCIKAALFKQCLKTGVYRRDKTVFLGHYGWPKTDDVSSVGRWNTFADAAAEPAAAGGSACIMGSRVCATLLPRLAVGQPGGNRM